ncbi:amino acid permease [Thermogemmatispora onikobensis]|uniref:amino acid permease n=1 Tax=Thermogemmatispora onikobensis TaxID=732234 RepID=UPI0008532433|nr:APC family permease [Thermogemmatispora onikobensis]
MIGQQPNGRDASMQTGAGGPLGRAPRATCPPALSHYYTRRALPRPIGSLDLCLLHFTAVFAPSPVLQLIREGPPALLAAALGALMLLLPMTLATSQLMALAPSEGALYSWTARLLGPYWGTVVGISDWLPGLLAAVSALVSFVATLQGLKAGWLAEPWQRELAILILLALLLLLGWQRQRTVQRIVNTFSALTLAIVILSGICSLVLLQQGAWRPPSFWRPGRSLTESPRPGGSLAALLYLGYSAPLSMAGELRPGLAPGRPLLGSTLLVCSSYLLVALAALVAPGGGPGLVLEMALGHTAGNMALVGLLAFYLCAAFVHTSACARLLFVASLDGLLPTGLALLNRERIPWRAFVIQTLLTGIVATVLLVVLPQMSVETMGSPAVMASLLATMTLLRLFVAFFCFYVTTLISYQQPCPALGASAMAPWLLRSGTVVGVAGTSLATLEILTHSWTPQLPDASWALLVGSLVVLSISAATLAALPATARASRLAPRLSQWLLQGEGDQQPQAKAHAQERGDLRDRDA